MVACLVLPGPTACGSSTDAIAVDREEYVAVYVDLLRISGEAEDSAEAARLRGEVLARAGRTPDDLSAFVDRHADDPDYLADVWAEIERRLREDTAGVDSPVKVRPDSSQ